MSTMASVTNSNNLLEENYSSVDSRLEELYHGYALTMDNWEEFYDAGLLKENWAWVDAELEKQCLIPDYLPCPAPISWVSYRSYDNQCILEPVQRSRAESDILDHSDIIERAINIQYNYCIASADEFESVSSSIDLGSDLDYNDLEFDDSEFECEFKSPYGWY